MGYDTWERKHHSFKKFLNSKAYRNLCEQLVKPETLPKLTESAHVLVESEPSKSVVVRTVSDVMIVFEPKRQDPAPFYITCGLFQPAPLPKSQRKSKRPASKKRASKDEETTAQRGYPAARVDQIKKKKWWCGDYACDSAGTGPWTTGQIQRMCDPDWDGCPPTLKLADGSKWTLSANCKQDG